VNHQDTKFTKVHQEAGARSDLVGTGLVARYAGDPHRRDGRRIPDALVNLGELGVLVVHPAAVDTASTYVD
jgi:hypothetical protein